MNSIILRIFKSTLVIPSNLCFKSSSKVLLLLLRRFLLDNVSWTLFVSEPLHDFKVVKKSDFHSRWFCFQFSGRTVVLRIAKKKQLKCGNWIFDLKTFFTSQWHSKTAYKSEVFTGNNFQNKAQWFDSFMCCFCCFFRRVEFFSKAKHQLFSRLRLRH